MNEDFGDEIQRPSSAIESRTHADRAHQYSMAGMEEFDQDNIDLSLMEGLDEGMDMDPNFMDGHDGDFDMNTGMFQDSHMPGVGMSHMWHNPGLGTSSFGTATSKPMLSTRKSAQSAQGEIVSARDQVVEQYGQITPPDDTTSFGAPSPADSAESRRRAQEDQAKKNRTQRARNAANTRHSKSKAARRDSTIDGESDIGEIAGGVGKSTNMQREKNRLAAAKCRAKKKATSEDMQENHREGSRQNSYLQREVRELRDQKAFLRNSLLQHEPGLCQCHAIHRFNFAQAQQLAMGVGALIGQHQQPMSPSQESAAALGLTQGSDGSMGGHGLQQMSERPNMPSRLSTVTNDSNFTLGQMSGSEVFSATAASPERPIPGQFSDFIHSSPNGGRGGFA